MLKSRTGNEKRKIEQLTKHCFRPNKNSLSIYFEEQYWRDIFFTNNWSHLQSLTIFNCSVSDQDLQCISQRLLPRLKQLSLASNKISFQGITHINKWIKNSNMKLLSLKLQLNSIGNNGLCQLLRQNNFQELSQLMVGNLYHEIHQKIDNEGAKIFVGYSLNGLKNLALIDLHISSLGIKYLTKGFFENLQQLYISNYCDQPIKKRIGSFGIKLLTKGHWPSLSVLDLCKEAIILEQLDLQGCNNLAHGNWNIKKLSSPNIHEAIGILSLCCMKWKSQGQLIVDMKYSQKISDPELNYKIVELIDRN